MLDKATVIDLAKQYATEVQKVFKPSQIVLYGSYSKGTAHEDSDIDIAVVLNGFSGDYLEASKTLYKLRRNVSFDIEPVLIDGAKDAQSGFIHEVMRTGEVIYDE